MYFCLHTKGMDHTHFGRQEQSYCLLYSVPGSDFSMLKNYTLKPIWGGDMSVFPSLIVNSMVRILEYMTVILRWWFFNSMHHSLIWRLLYACYLLMRGRERHLASLQIITMGCAQKLCLTLWLL